MLQNDAYVYKGQILSQPFNLDNDKLGSEEKILLKNFVLPNGEICQGIELNYVSNLVYDSTIPNTTLYITVDGEDEEQEINFYKSYSSPENIILKSVKILIDDNSRKYDTINFMQWRW